VRALTAENAARNTARKPILQPLNTNARELVPERSVADYVS
jgi:hypothetical protein